MALKPHQKVIQDNINFRCETTGDKGYLVMYNSSTGQVRVSNNVGSGTKVAGFLLTGVVAGIHPSNVALGEDTGTINNARNLHKNQTHVSGCVRILTQGELVTNAVSGTFNVGDVVRVMAGGLCRVGGAGEVVGHALSTKDSDGYVKVYVTIA